VTLAVGAATAVLIYGGYAHHWPWTGIDGKTATLWDWLHLLLLPIAVMIVPIWARQRKDLGVPHKAAAMTIVTAFAAVVLAGYLTPWPWTGFPGNTLWDWLHLLILPLLVPTVVIPALKPLATPEPAPAQEPGQAPAEAATAPTQAESAQQDTAPARAVAGHDRARLRHWAVPAALAAAIFAGGAVSVTLAEQAAGTPQPAPVQGTPGHGTTPGGGDSGGPPPASPAPAPPASTTGPAATPPPSSTIPGRAPSSPAATPTPAVTTPGHASSTASTPPSAAPSAAPTVPVPGPARPGLPASPAS
jgi:hypothetical protein